MSTPPRDSGFDNEHRRRQEDEADDFGDAFEELDGEPPGALPDFPFPPPDPNLQQVPLNPVQVTMAVAPDPAVAAATAAATAGSGATAIVTCTGLRGTC